jgi:hypothetical protein
MNYCHLFPFYAGAIVETVPDEPLYFRTPLSTYRIPPAILATGAVLLSIFN